MSRMLRRSKLLIRFDRSSSFAFSTRFLDIALKSAKPTNPLYVEPSPNFLVKLITIALLYSKNCMILA